MTALIILIAAPALAWFAGMPPVLIALVWVAAFLVMLVIWGSKSIPRAIVFVVVFPIALCIALAAIMVFGENANSERPRHVERATR
jgi:hypothetical protein